MTRSIPALALMVGGLLFGCGGMPEEGDSQAPSEGNVTQSAVHVITHPGVIVTFNTDTDTFVVQDNLADGHSAVAEIINRNTGSVTQCWNAQGAGTTNFCTRNYPNNPQISVRACTGEAGTSSLVSCSAWKTFTAFAPEAK
ncbi:MAG: hypothetical protein EOO72_08875 [Myxococcaceae bacterium]|nr:MAG: hypothetical protein EOO72_08875 [Myxococcaceae bacterium]